MREIVFFALSCILLIGNAVPQSTSLNPGDRPSPAAQQQHDAIYIAQAKKRLDSLKADTDRLSKLSKELQQEMNNVNPDAAMSVDVIRKADEIAKLAKQISGKMKGH